MQRAYENKPVIEAQVERLARQFSYQNLPEVLAFVMRHSFLIPLIREVLPNIKKHFAEARVFIEVVRDPEEHDEALGIFIDPQSLEADEALVRFDRLLDDWWLKNLGRAKGKMSLVIEYR